MPGPLEEQLIARQDPMNALKKATAISDGRDPIDRLLDRLIGEQAAIKTEPFLGSSKLGKVMTGLDQLTYGQMDPAKGEMSGGIPLGKGDIDGAITGIKGLYSRLNRAVDSLPDKLTAAAAKSKIMNMAGKEEMNYRSILKTVDGMKPTEKVAKSDLQAHLEANPMKVKVDRLKKSTIASDINGNPIYGAGPTQPKYESYSLPGGKNYREDLIQLDKQKPIPSNVDTLKKAGFTVEQYEATNGANGFRILDPSGEMAGGYEYDRLATADEALADHAQFLNEADFKNIDPTRDASNYRSNHWDQPNILAHVRHNERILPAPERVPKDILSDVDPNEFGAKGRFLEEVQSDWHEQGREQGYKVSSLPEGYKINQTTTKYNAPDDKFLYEVLDPTGTKVGREAFWYPEEAEKYALRTINENRVPDGPFKEDWSNLALKQQLLEVADRPDLEWMGWTPGSVQNDRYNLANHVSKLAFDHDPVTGKGILYAWDPDGRETVFQNIAKPEDLVPIIGKDAAARLTSGTPKKMSNHQDLPGDQGIDAYELTGQDLEIGGDGMRDFYDRQLPDKMNKILKPFGGRVEQADIPLGVSKNNLTYTPQEEAVLGPMNNATVKAWIARLSPEMKERIRKEGLPLLLALLGLEANQSVEPQQEIQ